MLRCDWSRRVFFIVVWRVDFDEDVLPTDAPETELGKKKERKGADCCSLEEPGDQLAH